MLCTHLAISSCIRKRQQDGQAVWPQVVHPCSSLVKEHLLPCTCITLHMMIAVTCLVDASTMLPGKMHSMHALDACSHNSKAMRPPRIAFVLLVF